MGARDKEIMNIKCSRCGAPLQIKYGSYRRSKEHLCRKCRGEDRHNEWESNPNKEEYHVWRSNLTKNGYKNMDPSKYEQMISNKKKSWNDDRKGKQTEFLKNYWQTMDSTKKDGILATLHEGRDKYWNKDENHINASIDARNRWNKQSEAEKLRILSMAWDASREYRANLSKEEKKRLSKQKSIEMKQWWNALSPEQRDDHMAKIRSGLKDNFDRLNIIPNKTEQSMVEILDSIHAPFEYIWYNKYKHPDFDTLFPSNPYRSLGTSPYHAWDFIVYLDKPILVDIDGSIHDKTKSSNIVHFGKEEFVLYDYIHFKEQQRPYQTDGLDAYVVLCYDDKLTDECTVINLKDNTKTQLKQFIDTIKFKVQRL